MSEPLPKHWQRLALRTPTLPPATSTNAVIIAGESHCLVVDPGSPYPQEQARLWRALERQLASGRSPRGIFLTHHHGDHHGGVAALRAQLALAGHGDVPVLAHEHTFARLPGLAAPREFIEEVQALPLGGDVVVEAVLTPGHAEGHLALWEPSTATAYGGDMVASEGTIIVSPPDGDMSKYLTSLRRLRALGLAVLVPSHGEPIVAVEAVLDHYIAHRLAREAKVVAALDSTARSLSELIPAVYPEIAASVVPLAERSLLAHLLKLQEEGRAVERGERWRATP